METEVSPVAASPVKCPSCGSVYNPATCELSSDTGLPARIAELESQLETLRDEYSNLETVAAGSALKVTELEAKLAERGVPEPDGFYVG